jgi:hypothetical protein
MRSCWQLLALFLLGIALFADFAVFLGIDTALVFAFFTGGFGLLAAGFSASEGQAAQKGNCTSNGGQCFHYVSSVGCCWTELKRANLLGFFFGIALLANFAFFGSFDAAFVSAFLTSSLGFFAAGFSASKAQAGQHDHGTGNSSY